MSLIGRCRGWPNLQNPAVPTHSLTRVRPVRFMIVGVANTTLGLTIIYTMSAFGASAIVANATAYFFGLVLSFVLNRQWTFGHSGEPIAAAARFLLVFALAYLCNLGTVLGAMHFFDLNHYFAQALGIPPFTLIFYFGASAFAFRLREDQAQNQVA